MGNLYMGWAVIMRLAQPLAHEWPGATWGINRDALSIKLPAGGGKYRIEYRAGMGWSLSGPEGPVRIQGRCEGERYASLWDILSSAREALGLPPMEGGPEMEVVR